MKTAFMSYVIGSKSFIDMAIVTILSYIETNDTEIDWLIFGNTEDELNSAKERLQNIKSNLVHIKVLPFTKIEDNDNFINYKNWISDIGSTMFYKRIKLIDAYKNNYDILVMVDLDIIFIKDISKYLKRAYDNDDIWISGQEQVNPEPETTKLNNNHHYINFGFGILKCNKLRNNEFNNLLKLISNPEVKLICQDQSYYNSTYSADKYFGYHDLQLCEWNFPWFYHNKPDYKIYHYSPMRYMDQTTIVTYDKSKYRYGCGIISLLVYDKYAEYVERYKQYLSDDFIEKVRFNNQRFLKERAENRIQYSFNKRQYGL